MSSAPKIAEKDQSGRLESVTKSLKEFGLPRIIVIVFFAILLFIVWLFDMNLPSFLGDVLRRWGMWGILVLAMVPGIQSGITLNFGVSIGIIGGMLGGVLAIEFNHFGLFDFVTNPELHGVVVAVVAILIGAIVGAGLGVLYGMLLNRVKGSEMAITVYVGFAVVNLFNILWARFPSTSGILVLPATGVGLRQMINLRDDFGGAFDNLFVWDFFGTGMIIRPILLLVFFLFCLFVFLFSKSRTGMRMSAAGANPAYAKASGINVNKMRILGTTISTVLGAVGIVVYAQSFGFLQMYNAPLMMGFTAVASVLIGGASIKRARVFDVLLGGFLFNGILVVALPLSTRFIPDVPGIPEMLRLIITNGIILFALTRVKQGG